MIWVRRLLVGVLSLLLLVALVSGVVAYSLNAAFSTPAKTQQWLSQSHMYKDFVADQVRQATQSASAQAAVIPNLDTLVRQAFMTAFPEQLYNQTITTLLSSNYDWLKGKTAIPQFRIDLSASKARFSQEIGQAATNYAAQLPACTVAQVSQLQTTTGVLALNCRPFGISPTRAGLEAERQVAGSTFLANPVITADTASGQQPFGTTYYKRLSWLPHAYQVAQKLPYILATIGLVSLLFLYLVMPSKRRATRLVATLLIIAGVILLAAKLALSFILDSAHTGGSQKSLVEFTHRAIDYLARINLVGGVIYLALAGAIIIGLIVGRRHGREAIQ